MKHLTVDQITEFVSMTKMDADSLKLAADVTTHIRSCGTCLRKVRAYQLVNDGLRQRLLQQADQKMPDIGADACREHPGADS